MNFLYILCTFLIALMIQSCGTNKNVQRFSLENKATKLSHKDYLLVDRWVKNNLHSCAFLFTDKTRTRKLTEADILICIGNFGSKIPVDIPTDLREKLIASGVDYYLAEKLSPYLLSIPATKLSIILTYMVYSYAGNPKFIKTLINSGAETNNILIQKIVSFRPNKASCNTTLQILKKNKYLYLNNKLLSEPVHNQIIDIRGKGYQVITLPSVSYRRDVLFSAVNDPAYTHHCNESILAKALIRLNPNLRNSIDKQTGDTPLHWFLKYRDNLDLLNKLITKNNINKQNKKGQTPLHSYLNEINYPNEKIANTVKVLIKSGANINLKDKNGITVRELILKHPLLKTLLIKSL